MAKMLINCGLFFILTQWIISDALTECPVTANCSCSRFVDCNMRNLIELPPMVKTVKKFDYVSFQGNFIRRVENGYFSSLSISGSSLGIDLSYNRINYIGSKAFQGLENVYLDLRLDHNNLVALPSALLPLNNLKRLRISGIHTYDPEIVAHIRKSLTSLRAGDLTAWPEGLKLFTGIGSLYLFEMSMLQISSNDVTSLAPSLVSIIIEDSTFQKPLDGLCSLHKLSRIHLVNVTSSEGLELIPRCQSPVTSITDLVVDNSHLKDLSTVYESMPSLSVLDLKLPSLKSLTLPVNNKIEGLYLRSTLLKKLPASQGTSAGLKYLHIFDSKISSIEREDLRNFPSLRQIDIINSSLASISEDAFENNQELQSMYINSSNMTFIPKAVTRLPNVVYLGFFNSPITCSCDMAWLLGWSQFPRVVLLGDCVGNGRSLSSYTKNDLTRCVKNPAVG